jgi:hypothetical protein
MSHAAGIVASALIALSVLGGCATKYQDVGLTGGVAAQPITNDTYRIIAQGNGFTAASTVQDYVLLKSAETAVAAGKTHFIITGGQDTSRQVINSTPAMANTSVIGHTAFTTYTPGSSYVTVKPGQEVLVRVFTPLKNEAVPIGAFRAEEIIANIGPRVQRPS